MSHSKDLYLIEGCRVRRYRLGKTVKPIVLVRRRLYRVDNLISHSTSDGRRTFTLYDIDSTQPKGTGIYVDPDETMVMIDVARGQGRKAGTKLMDLSMDRITPIIIVAAIAIGLLTGVTGI